MLKTRTLAESARPAADALRRLLKLGGELPPAGTGLTETENAFVWLARLLVDARLCPSGEEASPGAVLERVSSELTQRFGPHAGTVFPLLAGSGRLSRSARSASPAGFQSAALDARILASTAGPWDDLGEVFGAWMERGSQRRGCQYYTPRPVAGLLLRRLLSQGATGRLYDPAMGTGQLLVPYLSHLTRTGASADTILRSVAGSELSRVSHCLAQANLLLRLPEAVTAGTPLPPPQLLLENSLWRYGDGEAEQYDLCCANPPYLGERRNKAFFDELCAGAPTLAGLRAPRADLLYYFLELALERVRPGGLVGFLTTAYWLTADGASRLREGLEARAEVLELVDFGEQRLFSSAQGHHSLLVVLRKAATEQAPARDADTRWVRVVRPGPLETVCEAVEDALDGAQEAPAQGNHYVRAGRGELVRPGGASGAWHIPSDRRTESVLARIGAAELRLRDLARVSQGLISGADRVSTSNAHRLRGGSYHIGEGVFVLETPELVHAGLRVPCPVLRPFYKNSDIERYGLPGDAPQRYVVYLDGSVPLEGCPPQVVQHLSRYRALLEERREVRLGSIPWWRLHWPRTEALFGGPKILCPHRAPRNTFAFSERPVFASADVYYIAGLPDARHFAWLTGVLNSRILDFWCDHRGKRKGGLREYYATPLKEIPLPRPQLGGGDEVRSLAGAAPLDEGLAERMAWHASRGDVGPVDHAIARASQAIIDLRSNSSSDDLRQIAMEVIEERRLEAILTQLAALRYGLTNGESWMLQEILEAHAEG